MGGGDLPSPHCTSVDACFAHSFAPRPPRTRQARALLAARAPNCAALFDAHVVSWWSHWSTWPDLTRPEPEAWSVCARICTASAGISGQSLSMTVLPYVAQWFTVQVRATATRRLLLFRCRHGQPPDPTRQETAARRVCPPATCGVALADRRANGRPFLAHGPVAATAQSLQHRRAHGCGRALDRRGASLAHARSHPGRAPRQQPRSGR